MVDRGDGQEVGTGGKGELKPSRRLCGSRPERNLRIRMTPPPALPKGLRSAGALGRERRGVELRGEGHQKPRFTCQDGAWAKRGKPSFVSLGLGKAGVQVKTWACVGVAFRDFILMVPLMHEAVGLGLPGVPDLGERKGSDLT